MGGLSSVATAAVQALSVANTVLGATNSYKDDSGERNYKELQQRSALELQNAHERAALEKEQIRLNAEQTESQRRAALKRAIAKQRAQFGSSGTGTDGGSAEAVLLGLFDESAEELSQRNALDVLKSSAVDQSVSGIQRINTLQLTQQKERNKYNRYTSAYSSGAGLVTGLRNIFKEEEQ